MPPPSPAAGGGTQIDSGWFNSALTPDRQPPPQRRATTRTVLILGLLGASVLLLWLHWLAAAPHLPLTWRAAPGGGIELDASGDPAMREALGRHLRALVLPDGERIEADSAMLPRSPRWTVDDGERQRYLAMQARLGKAVVQPQVALEFENNLKTSLSPRPRGLGGLGAACWLMCALALALALAAALVTVARPGPPAALYALMAMAQAVNLLLIGAETLPGLGLPALLLRTTPVLRLLADLVTLAAVLHTVLVYPQRRRASGYAWLAWPLAVLLPIGSMVWPLPGLWWWSQAVLLVYAIGAVAALRSIGSHPGNPLADMLRRMVLAGGATLLLLNLAMAFAAGLNLVQHPMLLAAPMAWAIFLAALLMLAPFLSLSHQGLRELTLLAGACSVATSLDLLLDTLFMPGTLLSIWLAGVVALALYLSARAWMLNQLAGAGTLSAERMFESLYRAARELEQTPEQGGRQIGELLREVFDPLEVTHTDKAVTQVRVATDGSTLVVPAPQFQASTAIDANQGAIVLRFARHGRRLFTQEDRQLAERLIEQLRRAVAYDRAVELGRTEERARIAQDLHDDIGARLLTLMYQAQNPEIEQYIRYTLQDLKTLTRGLAAGNHQLAHAAGEWKSDITQRLAVTGCDLHWSFSADRDILLTVVQWSGLTRVLRELVNNIICHAHANQVEISVHFDRGLLMLSVSDDGCGRQPAAWSHGLGLGGVRKRVKLLGGQVLWSEGAERGIRCEVRTPLASEKG